MNNDYNKRLLTLAMISLSAAIKIYLSFNFHGLENTVELR